MLGLWRISAVASTLVGCGLRPAAPAVCPHVEGRGGTDAAWCIAERDLRRNIVDVPVGDTGLTRRYLLAGHYQFHALWARDLSFSTGGALVLGERAAVRDSLEALLGAQCTPQSSEAACRECLSRGTCHEGLIPRGIDDRDPACRVFDGAVLHLPDAFGEEQLRAQYISEYHVISLDSNLAVPWAASRYVLEEPVDLDFARRWFPAVQGALKMVEDYYCANPGPACTLVSHQPCFSDWEDSVERRGDVAYSQVMYVLALDGAAKWAHVIGRETDAKAYETRSALAARELMSHYRSPAGILTNFDGDRDVHRTADANVLAAAYVPLLPGEAAGLLDSLRDTARELWQPMPGRPTFPDYPASMKGSVAKLGGLSSYHDEDYWLWIAAAAAIGERVAGNCDAYNSIMARLAWQIEKDREVWEILEHTADGDLRPVCGLRYTAEHPFSWSAAMYLEAASRGCQGMKYSSRSPYGLPAGADAEGPGEPESPPKSRRANDVAGDQPR
jgi:GH15 family glucan-1,4-alpha-glucosidase